MKKKLLLILIFTCVSHTLKAQNNEPTKAVFSSKISSLKYISSIASRPEDQRKVDMTPKEAQDGKAKTKNTPKIIIGKDKQKTDDYFTLHPNALEQKIKGKTPELVFDGAESNSQPTDPALAVGPDHVMLVFNTGFRIFDKNGTPLTDQLAPNPTIFPDSGCCDLTASYDNLADRWVLTFLGSGMQVAVSDGPDPVNDGWYVYTIAEIDDYNKLSVWHDGYYVTNNGSPNVVALERAKMLSGDTNAQVIGFDLPDMATNGFNSAQAFNISNNDYPTGDVGFVYMQDDAWAGVDTDHLKLWTLNMDWANSNGTMSSATEIGLTPFISVFDGGGWDNLQQPNGVSIDALQATIMNQAQFRKFSDHNSAIFNFVIDTDSSAEKLAGIRWVELRQDNDSAPWSLYQEGTYTSPNGKHAWNASLIMDSQGNIGMGYSGMGGANNKHVGMYYTGRYVNDPLGTMSIAEEIILEGDGDFSINRYGDYSKIDVDPTDDKTFWFADELISTNRKDVVGVFKIAPNLTNDLGVISVNTPTDGILTNSETITVTVFNFGINPQTNFPISLMVDGTTIATENFTGTLDSTSSAQFTFSQTTDLSSVGQTYTIKACTVLASDEDTNNNCNSLDVKNLEPYDIGVTTITAPTTGTNLGNTEQIIITLTNFGGLDQSDFDVSYTLNGTTVTETVSGPLNSNSEMSYTFNQTGDFSEITTYDLSATTALPNDADVTNDSSSVTIIKTLCQPTASCSDGDGFSLFNLSTINNTSDCSANGYSDYSEQIADLKVGKTYPLTITTGYGDEFIRVWIDFNDDNNFSLDELVVDNYEIADGESSGTYTETIDIVIPLNANTGIHKMRAKTNWNAGVPDDACQNTSYGETEDYTANVFKPINDLGITTITGPVSGNQLTNSEIITVDIHNYGIDSQTNFPISLTIDGNLIVTEYFTGTLNSDSSAQYTFNKTIDLSLAPHHFSIESCTTLPNDEDVNNDCFSTEITHLFINDIGITEINTPTTGPDLGNNEQIKVTIFNFGIESQSNFDVSYTLNGTTVTETVMTTLESENEMIFTFNQTGDFSTISSYNLQATTLLTIDDNTENDSFTTSIEKIYCEPHSNCSTGSVINLFKVSNIENSSDCGIDGYSNFKNIITEFDKGNTYPLTITTNSNQYIRVWIDSNDNGIFEITELVVDNFVVKPNLTSGSYTETMDLVIPSTMEIGKHVMRAKTNWYSVVPNDACESTEWGETEDYTANINSSLFNKSNFNVATIGADQFKIALKSTKEKGKLEFSVYNTLGNRLLNYFIDNVNGEYHYDLDMSYAPTGIYIIKLGDYSKRIVVK